MNYIQTQEGLDRGHELFKKFPGAVTACVTSRVKQYFDSSSYKRLRNRCTQMDKYIDNVSPAINNFISDMTPQTIRRSYVEYSSLFGKFLETDPLFSVKRTSEINADKEKDIVEVLTDNQEKTYYRERCLNWNIDGIVRYGTSIAYSFATNDYNANSLMTIKAEDGIEQGDYRQVYSQGENVVLSVPIHPLNFIIDHRANFMVAPDYMGFIGDISVSNLAVLSQNPNYIQRNLREVIELAKKGLPDEHWFGGLNAEIKDFSRGHSNITYLWTRLPIEGNEADPTWYAVEIVGGKIIRIEENILDGNTIPLSIMRILPRQYDWYGNTPLEDKISVQNLQYWLLNTQIESAARMMDRIVLYRKGTLDEEALNSRHQTGGLVPYSGQEPDLSRILYSPTFSNPGMQGFDWLMAETRRQDQESSAIPAFNPMSEGGYTNKTLGGAQMMASIGEMRMNDLVNQMAVGLKDVAKHHIVLHRNIVQDEIKTTTGRIIPKESLVGNIQFSVKISNVFNYIREGIDATNRLTQLMNYTATGRKEFAAVNVGQFVEDWVRNSVKRENIKDYLDKDTLEKVYEESKKLALAPPPPPEGQEPKPEPEKISKSIAFRDLPPEGQIQLAQQAGINLVPGSVLNAPNQPAPISGAATVPGKVDIMPGGIG